MYIYNNDYNKINNNHHNNNNNKQLKTRLLHCNKYSVKGIYKKIKK